MRGEISKLISGGFKSPQNVSAIDCLRQTFELESALYCHQNEITFKVLVLRVFIAKDLIYRRKQKKRNLAEEVK